MGESIKYSKATFIRQTSTLDWHPRNTSRTAYFLIYEKLNIRQSLALAYLLKARTCVLALQVIRQERGGFQHLLAR